MRHRPVQAYLERWGTGRAIDDPAGVDYPKQSAFAQLMPRHDELIGGRGAGRARVFPLQDELHERVDRAVSRLRQRDENAWALIVYHYRYNIGDGRIARAMKVSRQAVTERRYRAEDWVAEEIF